MGLAGKRLWVLTPMYSNQLCKNFFESMMELANLAARTGMKGFATVNIATSVITLSRNILAHKFLEGDGTHAVFIDADIGFDPRDVLRMLELDRDVIGGCCPIKIIDWNRIQQACKRGGPDYTAEEMQQLGAKFNFDKPAEPAEAQLRLDTPQKAKRLGTGLLMVKREVFEKLRQAHPDRWYGCREGNGAPLRVHEFFGTGVNSEREYVGEDYMFCDECRALGFTIWICPWTKMTHMGTHSYVGDLPAMAKLCSDSARQVR